MLEDIAISHRSYQVQNNEEGLVRQAKDGDKQAFAQLYEAYFERIYRYVAVKIGDRTEAEDMAQQVFTKAYQSLHTFSWQGKPVSAWFFRIAHNLIVDHLRRKEKKPALLLNESLAAGDDDPERMAEQVLDAEKLSMAMQHLTDAQREVISLRFAGGLSVAEAARAMGRSQGAVKALQHSAIVALRKLLSVKSVKDDEKVKRVR
ncbi:MAG: sigma-70 family RNA polymerase sigma factor [Chloroflexi bacterium]|nr:sigma-70 family RNA polymerase sigma factor [Chloroflexota bacterium]